MEGLEKEIFEGAPEVPAEFQDLDAQGLRSRVRLIDNEIRVLKDESQRLTLEQSGLKDRIKDNKEKVIALYLLASLPNLLPKQELYTSDTLLYIFISIPQLASSILFSASKSLARFYLIPPIVVGVHNIFLPG